MTTGVVAVTKADLADPARAARGGGGAAPRRRGRAGRGARRGGPRRAARGARPRRGERAAARGGAGGPLRLHVDRSFTIRGAGTVVTGTLWEGTAARGDEVRILPAGTPARIRSVQVHDEPRERAEAGQRVALNLAGVSRDEVARGDVIVAGRGAAAPRFRVDVALDWVTPDARPDGGTRVAVHHGTRETPARLAELGGRYFQLRLEQPLVPARGDRARDPLARAARHARRRRRARPRPAPPRPEPRPARPPRAARARRARARAEPAAGRRPTRPAPAAPAPLTPAALALEERLRAAGHEPPPDAERRPTLAALRAHGRVARLGRDMHIHRDALDDVARRVTALIAARRPASRIATLRDELQTSRRYAQALLELLDAERVTLRVGDERVLRKKSS